MRRSFFAIIAIASAALPLTEAAESGRTVEFKPCSPDGIEASCGSFEVFESRAGRSGRRISLKITILRAREPAGDRDPLFILAGGPGQAASENVKFLARVFSKVQDRRDIVMVDQRGTGGSNGLNCDIYGSGLQNHLGNLVPLAAIRGCIAHWNTHADLRFYTTDIAMGDLDEVRQAMGYEQINLFGTS